MVFAGAAQFSEPAKPPPGAPLTVAARIYFQQINAWSQRKNAALHNLPDNPSPARHDGGAARRSPIALLKTSFAAHDAKRPDQTAAAQDVAALLALMDDYNTRIRHVAAQMIGKEVVVEIIQAENADTLEAFRRALLQEAIRYNPAVKYAFSSGVPFPLGPQDVERASERLSTPSQDLWAGSGIKDILSDGFIGMINTKYKDTVPIGKQSFSKHTVINTLNAVRKDRVLKEMGPQAQITAAAASLAASTVKNEKFRNPDAAVEAVKHLPGDQKQALKNGTANPRTISGQIGHNYCKTLGDYSACRESTEKPFSSGNLSDLIKGMRALSSDNFQTQAPVKQQAPAPN